MPMIDSDRLTRAVLLVNLCQIRHEHEMCSVKFQRKIVVGRANFSWRHDETEDIGPLLPKSGLRQAGRRATAAARPVNEPSLRAWARKGAACSALGAVSCVRTLTSVEFEL
jgi:hypothetical protein